MLFIRVPHRELSRTKCRVYDKSEIFEDISVIEESTCKFIRYQYTKNPCLLCRQSRKMPIIHVQPSKIKL